MTRYKINKDFVLQKIGNQTKLFDAEKSVLFTLNQTATFALTGIQLGWDIDKVALEMSRKYKIKDSEAKKDLGELIEELVEKRIILKEK